MSATLSLRALRHLRPRAQLQSTTAASPLRRCNAACASFHTTRASGLPYKDDQDRESLKPRAQEYSKSGSDDDVAAHDDAAFNPRKTAPEEELATAGQGTGSSKKNNPAENPLEDSPANKEFAESGKERYSGKPLEGGGKGPEGEGAGQKPASGGGSPQKKGKVV